VPHKNAVKLSECIWLRNAAADAAHRACNRERRALAELGITVETYQGVHDQDSIRRVRDLIWKTDRHIVLEHLSATELWSLYPALKDRQNFSIAEDDWWSNPFWFTSHAEYLIYFTYNAVAIRVGDVPFARFRETAWLQWPRKWNRFLLAMTGVRFASLALAPLLQLWKWQQRRSAPVNPDRVIYFPYAIFAEDLPFHEVKHEYDYSNVGQTNVPWLMRDPYAPAYFSGTNLYRDRHLLNEALLACDGPPFRMYDWQREGRWLNFEQYCDKVRQSRFTLATGGLHANAIPKFLEFACLGTPMVGPGLPYDHPWLDQCLFPMNPFKLGRNQVRPLLEQALALHPKLRENCLRLRETLLRRYSFESVLRLAQDQIEGRPIPATYVRGDFKAKLKASAGSAPGPS
jgi:hypothetical protein